MDYEETTAFLGQCGRCQQEIFFLICASIVPNGLSVFSLVFLTDIPSHHCLIPDVNLTEDWNRAIIPLEVVNGKQELSRCSRYRLDVVRNLSAQGFVPGRDVNLTDVEQERCVDGWSYSKDIYQSTLVSEFNLVCNDQWKQPFTSTISFLGVLLGSFISGQLSDRFGRKPILFATIVIQVIFTFVAIFSDTWTTFSILLFISGLGQVSNYVSGFVLGTEVLSGNVRVLFSSMGICLSYAIGYMFLPLFAYFLRDWKSLMVGISLPGMLYLPLWWSIPESPRWLLSQGRVNEAEAIIRKAAKKNKVEAPQVIFGDYNEHGKEKETEEHHSVFTLLKTKSIRHTTIILSIVWITLSTGYSGLSLNTSQLHADPYISCFMSALVEVPAYICSWLALKYLPRRLSVTCSLVLEGLSLFAIPLIPQGWASVTFALEMLGKFALTTGAALIYPYTAEIYPTVIRNTATGTCITASRVGNCLAPFLLQLRVYLQYLPQIVLGCLALIAVTANLFLPETFGRPLPETVQQMHKRERIKFPFNTRKKDTQSVVVFESQL